MSGANLDLGISRISALGAAFLLAALPTAATASQVELAQRATGSTPAMSTDPYAGALSPVRLNAFWRTIEISRAGTRDQESQLVTLKAELSRMSPKEITEFAETMDALLDGSYSWKLWGAAHVMMGGASDDSFEYFRVWLVSRGRDFFETAVSEPDSIATMLPSDFDEIPDFELMAYAASEVWEAKTGSSEFDAQPAMMPMRMPEGEQFSDDEAELAKAYPKLFARFGHDPLQ